MSSPNTASSCARRGHTSSAPVVQRCRLGFSDGRSLRPYFQRHRLSIKRATEMGLFWPKGARGETMAGRIVIPELRSGQCIWMLGRAMDEERQPKYRGLSLLNPPECLRAII